MKSSLRNGLEITGFLFVMGAIFVCWLIAKHLKVAWVFVGGTVTADKCGHPACRSARESKRNSHGVPRIWNEKLPINANGGLDWCHTCMENMTPICPWCGEPVLAGTPITLYSPRNPHFVIPRGTAVYSRKPLQLVGCGGTHCAETGADYCGSWEPDGDGRPAVQRRPSMVELALSTGHFVIVQS